MRVCPNCERETTEKTCPHDGYRTVKKALVASQQVDPLLGSVFEERYRLDRLIGCGGFSAVYLGVQLTMDRKVAIKILKSELCGDLKEVARFQQEARAIASLRHPNIVEVHDFGSADDGSLYLVTEYLEGETLTQRLKRERALAPEFVFELARQTLDALVEAHAAGVVHRDLKPENLFIIQRGHRRDVIKLIDFGIAKLSGDGASNMTLTATGTAIGSPRFMSPEQCLARKITPQSDLYSLGCVLYEALAGRPLFVKDSPTGYLMAHATEAPAPLDRDGCRLSGPLVDFTMRCLEKRPEARPAGALAALRELDGYREATLVQAAEADGTLLPTMLEQAAIPAGPLDDPEVPSASGVLTGVLGATQAAPQLEAEATLAHTLAPRTEAGKDAPRPTRADGADGTRKLDSAQFTAPRPPATPQPPEASEGPGPNTSTGLAATDAGEPSRPQFTRRPAWLVPAAVVAALVLGVVGWLAFAGSNNDAPAAAIAEVRPAASAPTESRPAPAPAVVTAAATEAPLVHEEPPVQEEPPLQEAARVDAQAVAADGEPAPAEAPAEAQPTAAASAETPTATEKPAATDAPAEPTVVLAGEFTVTVTSAPAGASVFRAGRRIGTTPLAVTWQASDAPPVLALTLRGYRKTTIDLTRGDAGGTRDAALEAVTQRTKSPRHESRRPVPAKPAKPAPTFKMLD